VLSMMAVITMLFGVASIIWPVATAELETRDEGESVRSPHEMRVIGVFCIVVGVCMLYATWSGAPRAEFSPC
jgi:hypothetical protein